MNKEIDIVVLVEDNLLRTSLVEKINGNNNCRVTASFESGVKCLKYLSEHECDLLIIDLMLKNIDGIGIIKQLKIINEHAFKQLFCISDFADSLIFEILEDLSVDYCLRKPFNLDYFIQLLNKILKVNSKIDSSYRETILKNEINHMFIEMGIPRHLKGYKYLVTSISNVSNDISLLSEVTKELYPKVARTHETTSSRVEQAIRHVLKVTWTNGNKEELERIFGFRAKHKPCNSEFISRIVDILLTKYDN